MFGEYQLIEENRRVGCSQCAEIIIVQESQLPKVIECPVCGWKRKIDKDTPE